MTEHDLSRKLAARIKAMLRPDGFVCIKHNQRLGVGVPDFSLTGRNVTSWWEVKRLVKGRLIQRGIQAKMMSDLHHAAGQARYVMFYDDRTVITDGDQNELISWPNFGDVDKVVDYMRWVHAMKESS